MSQNFSISQFSSAIAKHGLYSPNKFEVDIKLPASLSSIQNTSLLNFMCESASIAGKTTSTFVAREYGLKREIPYNDYAYDPLNLVFLCSENLIEKTILDSWNEKIVSPLNGSDVAYLDDIKGTITVYSMNRYAERNDFRITYYEVFPKTIQSIDLNHSSTNQISKLTVAFSYSYYETTRN